MRIIAGEWRGRRLASVGKGDAGAHLRPTTDRVRESLFSILSGGRFGDPLSGAETLDLFAGTGALGLEALSRGAAHCTFVDDGRAAGRLLRDNIRMLEAPATILTRDARKLPPNPGAAATLIFLDPPYGKGLGAAALAAAARGNWIASGALIVFEEAAPQPAPEGYALLDTRRFGDTHVTFLEAVA